MSTNNITGDKLTTGIPSKEYRNNYDSIFRKKENDTMSELNSTDDKYAKAIKSHIKKMVNNSVYGTDRSKELFIEFSKKNHLQNQLFKTIYDKDLLDITTIVGENGVGKSRLLNYLKMQAVLDQPTGINHVSQYKQMSPQHIDTIKNHLVSVFPIIEDVVLVENKIYIKFKNENDNIDIEKAGKGISTVTSIFHSILNNRFRIMFIDDFGSFICSNVHSLFIKNVIELVRRANRKLVITTHDINIVYKFSDAVKEYSCEYKPTLNCIRLEKNEGVLSKIIYSFK